MTMEESMRSSMSRAGFEQLCRDASINLGLDDTLALGSGHSVVFDGVLLQLQRCEDADRFVLLAEMGQAAEDRKAGIYEHLLMLQMLSWAQPGLRFGFNPDLRSLVMCLEAGCGPGVHAAWLASVVRSMTAQVTRLRSTVLAGDIGPQGDGDTDSDNPLQAAAEKFVAIYESSLAAAAPAHDPMISSSQEA